MSYSLKFFLFAGLFAALCVKGGEWSVGGESTIRELLGRDSAHAAQSFDPKPLKPREEEFRGISPVPDLAARLPLPKRTERSVSDTRFGTARF
ncbi:hypothetical protein G3N56_05185 [Desulfovibrio sulfodismutans]|uniref:Uncharacterized protein n=1 Tax=Desulfolutivibrio sulfodismutans TaxID=63561 RepID=A0A7K3NLS4_9BACT|nr:hypothetical protein [Desulfolutivibrio sulfodismutans]NDY56139.1 hypothetical protein [Desulfolutivibrio sulfodismutans]QLA13191.1 hypothetical protein GD606_13395 [Desulfolutivibrio sulfodismutans DSM 3696]